MGPWGLFGISGASHDHGGGRIGTGALPLLGVQTDLRVRFPHPPECPPLEPFLHLISVELKQSEREVLKGYVAGMEETHTHVGGLFGSACVPLVQVRATISELGPRHRRRRGSGELLRLKQNVAWLQGGAFWGMGETHTQVPWVRLHPD